MLVTIETFDDEPTEKQRKQYADAIAHTFAPLRVTIETVGFCKEYTEER